VLAELETARRRADTTATQSELDTVRADLSRMAEVESQRDASRARRNALAEESAALKGQNDRLGPETEPLKQRVELLAAATEPACPTCGQPLSPDHRQHVIAGLARDYRIGGNLPRECERLNAIKAERRRSI
jgi:DNA repair exonuclease SbcCD ATPase subunit